ncbi:MAG: hypothetical protein M3N48_01105 [Verrucomicrobiota bacterium]|nr:hypothetical protein [Verrucomicrobiota bacterium]
MSTSKRDEEIASGLPENLDALPRLDGFRLRGLEMTRLETFIDAAFAFAVTLVVIAADRIPDDIDTLPAAFKNVPAFVASVVVLRNIFGNVLVLPALAAFAISLAILRRNPSFGSPPAGWLRRL